MKSFVSRTLIAAAVLFLSFNTSLAEAKVEKDQKFPEFNLPTLDGKGKMGTEDLKGKIVLVDFWAHWCEPCKISFPVLNKLAAKYKGKVVVVGINVDEAPKDAKSFLKDNPAKNIKILSDSKKSLVEKIGVAVMPTSFILDKEGTVKLVHQGFHAGDEKEYEKVIQALVKGK